MVSSRPRLASPRWGCSASSVQAIPWAAQPCSSKAVLPAGAEPTESAGLMAGLARPGAPKRPCPCASSQGNPRSEPRYEPGPSPSVSRGVPFQKQDFS